MLAAVLHSGKFPHDKQCPGNTCRRQCRGEDEGSHPVDEILAYRPAAGDVCAGRRRCLAEGAHEEIYIPDASGFFGAAQTARLVALISKKKFAILAEQDKIRRCYTQLGKVYYKDYVTDEEPDDAEYDPLCERISQSFRRINRLRQELEAAKAKLAGEQPEDEAEPEAKPETEPESEATAEEEDFADNETPEAPEENS